MSFFSTSDILQCLVSGDLIKSIIDNPGFKKEMEKINISEYFSDEVMDDILKKIFKHKDIKKHLQKMIIEILKEDAPK